MDAGLLHKLEPCYSPGAERAELSVSLQNNAVCEHCHSRQMHRYQRLPDSTWKDTSTATKTFLILLTFLT